MYEDIQQIAHAIGRIPSGCAILTVQYHLRRTGMMVSWVQQASFEPPCVTVCLRRGRPVLELVDGAGQFVLNLLGDDANSLMKHFAGGFTPDEDAFEGLAVQESPYGPVLDGCIASLACRVKQLVPVGDHFLYACEIVAAKADPAARPFVHLRRSGLSY